MMIVDLYNMNGSYWSWLTFIKSAHRPGYFLDHATYPNQHTET